MVAPAAPRLVQPVGPQQAGVERFAWEPVSGASGHTLVLLDAGYVELARRDVGAATGWSADGEVKALLGQGRLFHWFVLAAGQGGLAKSAIESFEQP